MKVGVGAIESYESVGCAWGTWSVFKRLHTSGTALENFWSKMGIFLDQVTMLCLVGATPFRSAPTPKMCQDANSLSNA